jgi:plastocyanin
MRVVGPLAIPVLLLALVAGCISNGASNEPVAPASVAALSTSLPTFTKFSFSTDVTSPTDPVDALLGKSHDLSKTFDVPAGTGEVRVSIDVQPAGQDKAAFGDVVLRVKDADGTKAYESGDLAKAGKVVAVISLPKPGTYTLTATYKGVWKVGAVAVSIPLDYTPGLVLNVSSPEQTQVEHTFYPAQVTAKAGAKARMTLFDYDPHAGIDNLQHNIFIPALNVKTEGRTTWGEVRTLDFTAPTKAGEYEFYCEFHKAMLKGTLTVV